MSKAIYGTNHPSFLDKIVVNKRIEIIDLIKSKIELNEVESCLDVGTTIDFNNESSNIIIKSFSDIKIKNSISNQVINNNFFKNSLNKSITDDLSTNDLNQLKSDLVIASATIEHVGSFENQKKMLENIIKLSKKFFVITTPNRYYPIDFHTKIPFIHWLPKSIHRFLLKLVGLKYFSNEENLNLLSKKDLKNIIKNDKYININFSIETIKLFGLISNFIIVGKIN